MLSGEGNGGLMIRSLELSETVDMPAARVHEI